MARAGMADLITRVRAMAHAGTADHTVAGVVYWTDDQIQGYLDQHRVDYYEVPLQSQDEIGSGGTVTTTNYYLPNQARWIEQYDSESLFRLYQGNGTNAGTASYTVNYDSRLVEFTSDTEGTAYYVDFSAYDLNETAADIWEEKASIVSVQSVDWSTDNHSVKSSQMVKTYMDQAKKFRLMGGNAVRFVRRIRGDEVRPWSG